MERIFLFSCFFTRLWEFLIVLYHFVKRSYYNKEWIIFILFFLFLFVLFNGFNYEIYNKLFAVLFAFSIICFNSKIYISYLFENKFLVFLGFISYALYLCIGQFFHCLNTMLSQKSNYKIILY